MAEQIGQCHDAQLLEPLGGLGPHALEVAHRRVRGRVAFLVLIFILPMWDELPASYPGMADTA